MLYLNAININETFGTFQHCFQCLYKTTIFDFKKKYPLPSRLVRHTHPFHSYVWLCKAWCNTGVYIELNAAAAAACLETFCQNENRHRVLFIKQMCGFSEIPTIYLMTNVAPYAHTQSVCKVFIKKRIVKQIKPFWKWCVFNQDSCKSYENLNAKILWIYISEFSVSADEWVQIHRDLAILERDSVFAHDLGGQTCQR